MCWSAQFLMLIPNIKDFAGGNICLGLGYETVETGGFHLVPIKRYLKSHQSQATVCSSCQQKIITVVIYEAGYITPFITLFICLFGGFLGCCLIPLCVSSCQDTMYTCPSCNNYIGQRHFLINIVKYDDPDVIDYALNGW
ncbi:unnamed protein product [Rotaria magnacalcarata]|uniref:LITAF domain-containing protein n=1 Tax=Rotaria magnacalcarata TaxID=392030 RepID=A0A8S2K1P2_9BILA|nr:unnamed protein product [Rotaria magnacalcarata]CAF3977083.1 unnamed protein product [Rotaria magnacalcarata]